MISRVTVSTGARLHFGLLSNGRSTGRQFGGAGVMVDSPETRLSVARSSVDEFRGAPELQSRLRAFTAAYRSRCPTEFVPPPVCIELLESPPQHVGLGTGTQLGLALARALATVTSEPDVSAPELAARVGRGLRSSLGIHGFEQGGFLIEGGKLDEAVSPLVARLEFPAEWRFVLIRPGQTSGLSGNAELEGFAQLAPMPQPTTDRLCRIVLTELAPAVAAAKFDEASDGLYEFGRIVGEYFSPVQQGIFSHPAMGRLASELRDRGVRGVGQTSWGPTLFALCQTSSEAETLVTEMRSTVEGTGFHYMVTAAKNCGAALTVAT